MHATIIAKDIKTDISFVIKLINDVVGVAITSCFYSGYILGCVCVCVWEGGGGWSYELAYPVLTFSFLSDSPYTYTYIHIHTYIFYFTISYFLQKLIQFNNCRLKHNII